VLVFLSAGGLRSFAHIGVLRVLRRAQVPVVVVSGVEWGALVAGIYSQSKGLNDVEWQMMKLRADQLPTKGLITRNFAARDSKELFQFTRFVFNEKRVESGASSFFCPTAEEDNVINIGEGLLKDEVLKCTVMPPLYSPVETGGHKYISGAVNPGDWVGEMKRRGAKYIIYVDVISRGKYFTQNYANDSQIKALWSGVKATSKAQQPFAQAVIEVPLDMDLNDFDTRRDAIAAGERAAVAQLHMILKNIGATH
jgi:NTE family protein